MGARDNIQSNPIVQSERGSVMHLVSYLFAKDKRCQVPFKPQSCMCLAYRKYNRDGNLQEALRVASCSVCQRRQSRGMIHRKESYNTAAAAIVHCPLSVHK